MTGRLARLAVALAAIVLAALAAGAAIIPLAGWALLLVGLLTVTPVLARNSSTPGSISPDIDPENES